MTEIEFPSSHLYPGAVGRLASGAEAIAASGQKVALSFADGSRAAGRLSGDRLKVEGYQTVAGTEIEAKAWRVTLEDGALRITDRL
ncbi:hypothetical protein [Histidinibacterium aquaticum]|uniref:Uncharacterized protein n=1 Tax=Histidinibacterium aquaticum TaxID=2613962 RepID=A0A5J5GR07_9RHOB|nr:hypothetical protein [Histidinibacterium aquaticum]KAA9010515.1 hypothetical protein F3S47_04525 [Histidinibacterium aquaticum]